MPDHGSLRDQFFRYGKVADCPIHDLHGHMGALQGAHLPRCTPEAMLASMDRAGVALTVFCHHDALFSPEVGNTVNIATVRRYPERFRAYCGVNPNHPALVRQDVAAFDSHRDVFVGFKLLADYHLVPVSDVRYAAAWEKADADGLPVLLHTWGGSGYDGAEQVKICAQRYARAQILMGHSCHGTWRQAAELARDFPNVYLELTAVLDDRGAVEVFLEVAGSPKIVFGTDTPWFNHHYYVGALLGAPMTDDDRRNILYRNAQRLLTGLMG
jgi:predicted TIM-barrel fold metal-dependent hydrolase